MSVDGRWRGWAPDQSDCHMRFGLSHVTPPNHHHRHHDHHQFNFWLPTLYHFLSLGTHLVQVACFVSVGTALDVFLHKPYSRFFAFDPRHTTLLLFHLSSLLGFIFFWIIYGLLTIYTFASAWHTCISGFLLFDFQDSFLSFFRLEIPPLRLGITGLR